MYCNSFCVLYPYIPCARLSVSTHPRESVKFNAWVFTRCLGIKVPPTCMCLYAYHHLSTYRCFEVCTDVSMHVYFSATGICASPHPCLCDPMSLRACFFGSSFCKSLPVYLPESMNLRGDDHRCFCANSCFCFDMLALMQQQFTILQTTAWSNSSRKLLLAQSLTKTLYHLLQCVTIIILFESNLSASLVRIAGSQLFHSLHFRVPIHRTTEGLTNKYVIIFCFRLACVEIEFPDSLLFD